ncbi:unnamed protein product [Eruca vesicaria subsp. sativa]|uniref:Uncharacterized protein n=1 Tax=Eruca vesicaria subsp. sativa TaxID=29727 RepID=A0ABC8K293_ERUVS|nr:unnamed protein product [Eruca vesicaria subsp. sativa]
MRLSQSLEPLKTQVVRKVYLRKRLEIAYDILQTYKNQGGYDFLQRTKDQIRTTEQVNAALKACTDLKLDGLVILGGVTSNTDAAHHAGFFNEAKCSTKVLTVLYHHILFSTNFIYSKTLHEAHWSFSFIAGSWCSNYYKWRSQESVC